MDEPRKGWIMSALRRITMAISPSAVREAHEAAEKAAAEKAKSQGTLSDVAKKILEEATAATAAKE